jgi:hypothetical protein
MFKIIVTIILTSAFFILFFTPKMKIQNKTKKRVKRAREEPSTTKGFIEDTYRGPITDRFIPPRVGKTGTFVGYTDVPEYSWLHGFPHTKISKEELAKGKAKPKPKPKTPPKKMGKKAKMARVEKGGTNIALATN